MTEEIVGVGDSSSTPLSGRGDKSLLRPCSRLEEKYICIRTYQDTPGRMVWYSLFLSSEGKKTKKKRKRCEMIEDSPTTLTLIRDADDIPDTSCIVALGTTIYNMGPHPRKRSKRGHYLRFCNFSFPNEEWIPGPQMKNPRKRAKAVTLAGKIYIFGGTSRKTMPWAEVFEPIKKEWKDLREPPKHLAFLDFFALALDDGSEKIAVFSSHYSHSGLYTYDTSNDSWETIDPEFCMINRHSKPVMVDSTFYWIVRDGMYAYDLDTMTEFSGPINCPLLEGLLDLNIFRFMPVQPPLIHLGSDMFCLMWTSALPDSKDYNRVLCVKLKVAKYFDPQSGIGSLKATEVSIQAFPADRCITSIDAILLS